MKALQIGIIGHGAFGQLLATLFSKHAHVVVYDKKSTDKKDLASGATVASSVEDLRSCNAIFIATELDSIRSVCEQLKPHVNESTIVADVCSVKVHPARIMEDVLSGSCKLLATHPLFGPQTVLRRENTRNQKLVWHELSDGNFTDLRTIFEKNLGVEIVDLSPEDHDKEMAWVHGLTFFAGRALLDMDPPKSTLGTNYYQKLIDLVTVESQHSEELFMTIQRGNPYTDEVRMQFMKTLQKYENKIKEEEK